MLGSKTRATVRELTSQVEELRAQATLLGSWDNGATYATWSGQDVDKKTSLQLLAVYGSVRMISDGISTMPVDVYRRKSDGVSEVIATPRWLEEPMIGVPFMAWCSELLTSLLLDGNSFFTVTRDDAGRIIELIPLANETVRVMYFGTEKTYLVNGIPFTKELVHIKAMTLAGSLLGLSPVEYARQTIGLGLAAEKYGSEFFNGPGNMPGVIEAPYAMQPEEMTSTARAWRDFRRKGGNGLPGVLQNDAKFHAIGVTQEQAQFLETRQWSAAEIAGQMFLLDPTDLGIPVAGTSLTYANQEQRNSRRLMVAFLPWMVRIEQALSALLFNPRYMKFNPAALVRGDLKTQYEAFAIGLAGAPFLGVDEVREKIDLGPMPESDTPDVPDVPDPADVPAEPQTNSETINITVQLPDTPEEPPRKVTRTLERDAEGRVLRLFEETA